MVVLRILVLAVIFVSSSLSKLNAQDEEVIFEDTVLENYESYFYEIRNSIHLHLNKTTYATGEHIWFSLYLFNQQDNTVSLDETFVYVALHDSSGKEIELKTIWYSYGLGNGEIFLDEELPSGDYYLRTYTAKMNLFKEDDSSVYPISVINFDSEVFPTELSSNGEIEIDIAAESGQLLDGVFGNCAFKIRDSRGGPIVPDSTYLVHDGPNQKTPLKVNSNGIGRFSLIAKRGRIGKLMVYVADTAYQVPVPAVSHKGYTLSTDLFFGQDELLVDIATNKATWNEKKEELFLFINKDGNYLFYPIQFDVDSLNEELILPYDDLFPGINTLTLMNSQGEVKAERLIFRPPNQQVKTEIINVRSLKDSINLHVKSIIPGDSVKVNKTSISVLPARSLSGPKRISMQSRFYLKNYLDPEDLALIQKRDYINETSVQYDLDALLMLRGKGRYRWYDILNGGDHHEKPVITTSQLDGYVNAFDTANDNLEVMLYSEDNGILEVTPLDEQFKFSFKELAPLAKNSKISFTLLDKKGLPVYANFFYTIQPNIVRYKRPLDFREMSATKTSYQKQELDSELFKEAEQLDEVVVTADKLKRQKFLGQFYGRKIDMQARNMVSLENLIVSYGYRVKYYSGGKLIYRECWGAGGPTPLFPGISFNGIYSSDITDFSHVLLEYIDEVYFLRKSRCDPGFFVVFTNDKYENTPIPESEKNTKEFTVNIGHDVPLPFKRPVYESLDSPTFDRYGIVSWIPNLISNDKGVYSFKVSDDRQKKLNLQLEGFNADGTIFSNSIEIEVNP